MFHRIFVQGNASPHCNPPRRIRPHLRDHLLADKPLPCDGDALIHRCIDDCITVGLIAADDRDHRGATRSTCPTPTWSTTTRARRTSASSATGSRSTTSILAGRYSEWEYYNSDHAFLAGRQAALQIRGDTDARASGAA